MQVANKEVQPPLPTIWPYSQFNTVTKQMCIGTIVPLMLSSRNVATACCEEGSTATEIEITYSWSNYCLVLQKLTQPYLSTSKCNMSGNNHSPQAWQTLVNVGHESLTFPIL
eukprot:1006887-Pelagomonas_calceolata.AAC.1